MVLAKLNYFVYVIWLKLFMIHSNSNSASWNIKLFYPDYSFANASNKNLLVSNKTFANCILFLFLFLVLSYFVQTTASTWFNDITIPMNSNSVFQHYYLFNIKQIQHRDTLRVICLFFFDFLFYLSSCHNYPTMLTYGIILHRKLVVSFRFILCF